MEHKLYCPDKGCSHSRQVCSHLMPQRLRVVYYLEQVIVWSKMHDVTYYRNEARTPGDRQLVVNDRLQDKRSSWHSPGASFVSTQLTPCVQCSPCCMVHCMGGLETRVQEHVPCSRPRPTYLNSIGHNHYLRCSELLAWS